MTDSPHTTNLSDATLARTPAAHPVPSNADLVKLAYETACDMEEQLGDIKDYAVAIRLMANEAADPTAKLAWLIEDARDALEAERDKLFHALHPRRHEPDFDDDGNGEVEEAEGTAS